MRESIHALCSLLSVVLLAGCQAAGSRGSPRSAAPEAVYLTWQRDPTTTMTVQWLSAAAQTRDEVSWSPRGTEQWSPVTGAHHALPHSRSLVHVVELTGLQPGRDYRFRIAGDPEEHAFRTVPADAVEPITFIDGGDVYRDQRDVRIYDAAARFDPLFVALGGDIVYSSTAGRWSEWLRLWQRHMVTSDGRLIPMVVAIGNHEVSGGYDRTPQDAPYFYDVFAFPGPQGYGVLDFGGSMSLFVLDSGHTHPVEGEQAEWLAEALAQRAGRSHLFATYHVPSYPSHRDFDEGPSPVIRQYWGPIFDRYGLDVAFEHHDHAYKRTHPIRGGQVASDGVLYLGDGAWGVPPRSIHDPEETWYLARSESINHFIVTTIRGAERSHLAVDAEGNVFDQVEPGSVSAAESEPGSFLPASAEGKQ